MGGLADSVRGVLRELGEDARTAAQHVALVSVGGSVLVPRSVRKRLYRALGADLASPPGGTFMFSGDPANLVVGRDVYFNQRVFVEAKGRVSIGEGSAIGMDVLVLTSHHEVAPDGAWSTTAVGRPVEIGRGVWIGARAVVLPGAVVEDGVVVAGGAVVAGRLLTGGLYAGVPARLVRTFDRPDGDRRDGPAAPLDPSPTEDPPRAASTPPPR